MDQLMVDVGVSIGPLWIRRQLFEHSVAVPLLTSSTASQIDFPRLATELVAASVVPPPAPPAVTYDAWVAAAGLHARLDSSEHAAIIVEALETNAPDAFLRCNDPVELNSPQPLPHRQLLIPVPELLAFIRLHAAATISTHFRNIADAVWPDPDLSAFPASATATSATSATSANATPANSHSPFRHPTANLSPNSSHSHLIPISLTPASPRIQSAPNTTSTQPVRTNSNTQQPPASNPQQPQQPPQQQPHQSPTQSPQPPQHQQPPPNNSSPTLALNPTTPINSPPLDSLVRKKSPNPISPIVNSQSAIIASAQHALERETRLVVSNLKALLLIIAAAYGTRLDGKSLGETASVQSTLDLRGAAAVESGTLSYPPPADKPRPSPTPDASAPTSSANSSSSATDAVMADDSANSNSSVKASSVNQVTITRQMFEHLSFLLTTTTDPSGAFRPMSTIVPMWNSGATGDASTSIPLGDLVNMLTTALTRVPSQDPIEGVIDVTDISNLDRKTIMRSAMPRTNTPSDNELAHASDVRIANCADSHFYLLNSLGRVSFIECRACTLFIGGCVSVSLINCENVRVHAIARVCRVTNCFDTHLYLCTNSNPQIVGENRGLVFAPYNASYPREDLDKHLAAVGVDANRNVWDKFYRPAFRGSSTVDRTAEVSSVVARTLAPEQFLPFGVPVRPAAPGEAVSKEHEVVDADLDGLKTDWDTSLKALFGVSLPLPEAYEEQLKQKRVLLLKIRKDIKAMEKKSSSGTVEEDLVGVRSKDVAMGDGNGDSEVAKESNEESAPEEGHLRKGVVNSVVQERFREWLNHSGRIRQINDLVRLEQES